MSDIIRQKINQRIIDALEKGHVPFWNRPWKRDARGDHHNFISKKAYRGVNAWVLELTAMDQGWINTTWGTMKQWNQFGGRVRKGEKASMIVFWKPVFGDEEVDGKKKVKAFLLRYYNVFNVEQIVPESEIAGKALDRFRIKPDIAPDIPLTEDYKVAQEIVDACVKDGLIITHKGDKAFWKNDTENVTLPERKKFITPSHYFETLFHEISHWTELERHTDWDRLKHGYAMGELRAEISCAYLANYANIPHAQDLDNHTAYIKSWLEQMKKDDQWIFRACKFADAAATCILRIAGMNGESEESAAAA